MNVGGLLAAGGLDTIRLRLLIEPVTLESVEVSPAPGWMRRIWGRGIRAMTLGSRIFVDPSILAPLERSGEVLLVHELIHVRQWREHGVLGFLYRYLADYLKGRFSGKGHRQAYLDIGLEVEARRLAALF